MTTQEKKKALIDKCITKLGKSTASQMPVNKITLLNDNGFEKGKNDISKVSFVSNGAFRLATQKGRCPEKEGSQKRKATPDFA